ncbi:hypothetical protein [Polaribacter sp. Hel1_85]|nr:hypothetical protein [Polaribacter sp. Hel1_85]KGL62310.1 hypothetical protein PHEL85_2103 [Polaribacter sp. Hel1_85]
MEQTKISVDNMFGSFSKQPMEFVIELIGSKTQKVVFKGENLKVKL